MDIHAFLDEEREEETVFQELFLSLEKQIKDIVVKSKNGHSLAIRSLKSRPDLHQFRAYDLPKSWTSYGKSLNLATCGGDVLSSSAPMKDPQNNQRCNEDSNLLDIWVCDMSIW